jgi:hypothetical protein
VISWSAFLSVKMNPSTAHYAGSKRSEEACIFHETFGQETYEAGKSNSPDYTCSIGRALNLYTYFTAKPPQ